MIREDCEDCKKMVKAIREVNNPFLLIARGTIYCNSYHIVMDWNGK